MTRSRHAERERGATLVEFAIVMPVFFMLLFGNVEMGLAFHNRIIVNDAVQNAGSLGSALGNDVDVDIEILDRLAADLGQLSNDGTDNVAAICGLWAMTLFENASSPTSEFKIAKLDEIYADAGLVLSLFVAGDIGGLGSISFTGAFAGINFEIQVRYLTGTGVVTACRPDHQYPGRLSSSDCGIDTSNNRHDGQWLDFKSACHRITHAAARPAGPRSGSR